MVSVEPLRKILQMECSKGYPDLVVIGGLDRYLRRWASEARDGIAEPRSLRRFEELHLANPGYAALDRSQRQEWIASILHWLTEMERATSERRKAEDGAAISSNRLPAAGTRPRPRHPSAAAGPHSLDSHITLIKGISSGLAAKFRRLGVRTVRDLLYFFPRRHLDYSTLKTVSELEEAGEQTILATVWEAQVTTLGSRRGTEAIVGDETGNLRVVWFNQPYLAKKLPTNARMVLSGRVSLFKGRKVFESPEWELVEDKELIHTGRLVPVYPLTEGLRPRPVRKVIKETVDLWAGQVPDFLPPEVISRCQLMALPQAIGQAHYPDSSPTRDSARGRLAFDELFLIQLGVLAKKHHWQQDQPGSPLQAGRDVVAGFLSSLPFALTPAQERVLAEILDDLGRSQPMCRLLQGEVGSGKTVVAIAALLAAVASGYQGALMAPTEILAEQHFASISRLLSPLSHPITLALLTGSIGQGEKQELHRRISAGEVDIVIGTHALIQKGVEFERLGLAVVDEQHRFGVMQRSALRHKGVSPHVLVMTATPIPRTLALTLYGDLDISVIDQLPPGRQTVKTKWLDPGQRDSAYAFVQRQIDAGRQGFIICPLIEESENIETKAAIAEYQRLSRDVFPQLKLGLLHGRLSAPEKEEVMRRFRAGDLHILVSTPVVEVGIDVPNATVMLIEGADRFGLSPLHQFRGRVGRGEEQSYCLLLAEAPSAEGRERLALIERIQDGFILAEEDLRLRGPGEFFGTRQSGLPDLRMARLSDIALLEQARGEALRLFEQDPELEQPEHRLLASEVSRLWKDKGVELD